MKFKKRIISCIMALTVIFNSATYVYAGTDMDTDEWYDLSISDIDNVDEKQNSDVQLLSTRYIVDVMSSLKKTGPRTVALRSDVYCSQVMKKIEVYIQLQKIKNNVWVTVGEGSSTSYNKDYIAKVATTSNLAPGVYRCKSFAVVTDDYGYAESLASASGGVTFP